MKSSTGLMRRAGCPTHALTAMRTDSHHPPEQRLLIDLTVFLLEVFFRLMRRPRDVHHVFDEGTPVNGSRLAHACVSAASPAIGLPR